MNNETIGEAPRFIGRFYFKLTSNGNLIGEYSNSRTSSCCSEAANRVSEWPSRPDELPGAGFIGKYDTAWREGAGVGKSRLVIEREPNRLGIFKVAWTTCDTFVGEGMLCDDILIGDYRPV